MTINVNYCFGAKLEGVSGKMVNSALYNIIDENAEDTEVSCIKFIDYTGQTNQVRSQIQGFKRSQYE